MIHICTQDKQMIDYDLSMQKMYNRVQKIASNEYDLAWFLQYNHIYTCGSRGNESDLLSKISSVPVVYTNRGGQWTYHGPGQQVCYLLIDLNRKYQEQRDVRQFVRNIEEVIISTLKDFDIIGERRHDRVGIWVVKDGYEQKIASIGMRIKQWITMHGFALNINPDLNYFNNIVPCGIKEYGTCSMQSILGHDISAKEVRKSLSNNIIRIFNYQTSNLISCDEI